MTELLHDLFKTSPKGVLNNNQIRQLINAGAIKSSSDCTQNIQPASIDLRLGKKIWIMRAGFSVGIESVESAINLLSLGTIDATSNPCLTNEVVYLAEIDESLDLPKSISASFSPKSSTGRLNIFTRVLADGAPDFDQVPAGYKGKLYLEISPRSFPIILGEGSKLCQVRFHQGTPPSGSRERTTLSVDLSKDLGQVIGYRAQKHTAQLDMSRQNFYNSDEFWTPIFAPSNKSLILEPGAFYLLASKESVFIPPEKCAEMVAFDATLGEFRAHYAGFFDPGFGTSQAGGSGSRAVLEVRVHDMPFLLRDGQPICRMAWEQMSQIPTELYGQEREIGKSYQGQKLKLPRIFKTPKY